MPLDTSKTFDVTKHIRFVPPFQEKEVDKYVLHFKKVAENLKWPKEYWTLLLQSVVIGKAREIYTQLSVEQSSDYDKVKELILKAYELVPEAYRQTFRDCRKEHDQTHVEFARTKEQLFDRWCSSKKVGSDYTKLRQLMLVEESKRCINSDVKAFLDEKEVETLDLAARLADDYSLTSHFLGNHLTLNQNLHLSQDHFPLSQNHIPPSQVQNSIPVIHLTIPVIHLLQNLNFLVKTKVKVPYPSPFAVILNNLAISFLNV